MKHSVFIYFLGHPQCLSQFTNLRLIDLGQQEEHPDVHHDYHDDEKDKLAGDALAEVEAAIDDHQEELNDEKDEERGRDCVAHDELGDISLRRFLLLVKL